MRGLAIPNYPRSRWACRRAGRSSALWTLRRPDIVHIVTEGPLGWSALQAAEKLKLPAVSDFRTNFHAYSAHYGVGWLKTPIVAYLRKFHNRTLFTLVPTDGVRSELGGARLPRPARDRARRRHRALRPRKRDERCARVGRGRTTRWSCCAWRGWRREKNIALCRGASKRSGGACDARLVLVGDGPERAAA